jgi:cysteine synthase A
MYELERDNPDVIWVDQIYNKYNYIGQMSMGKEIYKQLDGKIDAWGCSIGSGGCLLGVTLGLKELGVNPHTFAVVPGNVTAEVSFEYKTKGKGRWAMRDKLVRLMGLKKWQTETSIVETMFEMGYPNEVYEVNDENARKMANRLAREEGIYCGMSSGANVFIALKIAERMKAGQNVVTTIVDRRDRYLGEYPNDIYVV